MKNLKITENTQRKDGSAVNQGDILTGVDPSEAADLVMSGKAVEIRVQDIERFRKGSAPENRDPVPENRDPVNAKGKKASANNSDSAKK